jgi:hypothetical protein
MGAKNPTPAELPSDLSQEDVRRLAHGLGLTIPGDDLAEVTYRFTALMEELNKLAGTDLSGTDPLPIFPPMFLTEGGQTE